MRYHVLGVGAIGTLVAHHLRHSTPSPVSLIYRHARKVGPKKAETPTERPPLSIFVKRGETGSQSTGFDIEKVHDAAHRPDLLTGVTPEAHNGQIDSLIVCLKTPDTLLGVQRLSPRLTSASVITLLQNGMGVYDQLCQELFQDPMTRPQFILGTTTHGVTRTRSHGVIRHMSRPGEGEMKFGVVPDPRGLVDINEWIWPGKDVSADHIITPPPSPALPLPPPPTASFVNLHNTLNTLLSLSELSPSLLPMPHLHHQLLLKLAINSAINPLTAILGLGALPNGALLSNDAGYKLIRDILAETSRILLSYIHSLSAPDVPSVDVLRLFSEESLERRCFAVIRETKKNTSSMAADIARGKVTEIANINGYLVSLAARLDVPAPTHKMLVDMVKYISAVSHPMSVVENKHRLPLRGVRSYAETLRLQAEAGGEGTAEVARAGTQESADIEKPVVEVENASVTERREHELEVRRKALAVRQAEERAAITARRRERRAEKEARRVLSPERRKTVYGS
ncbi:ketopantoate reductase PanE/ApbA C terminal-domain-containing protein [Dioszegia hungarica]|uniref:2-dehydropantoate 2-reductase n=1 Tax=Dioszegia hungarica TaxID=4972 RepID=A0AA38HAN0_9TREE|nr:ketopantoate reductase PanE/ApbA C terminal-domain-containing protein [Dioszegia hungarica]KAI9636741.1 ketopantoate reductase PanE/ApbA C terminal-domain-containing protein [Dioszegia hungarica]